MFYEFLSTAACLLIGLATGYLYGYMHKKFLNKLMHTAREEVVSKTYLFAAVRIAASSLLIFSAFLFGLMQGLVCLAGFLISRWVWIALVFRNRKDLQRM